MRWPDRSRQARASTSSPCRSTGTGSTRAECSSAIRRVSGKTGSSTAIESPDSSRAAKASETPCSPPLVIRMRSAVTPSRSAIHSRSSGIPECASVSEGLGSGDRIVQQGGGDVRVVRERKCRRGRRTADQTNGVSIESGRRDGVRSRPGQRRDLGRQQCGRGRSGRNRRCDGLRVAKLMGRRR